MIAIHVRSKQKVVKLILLLLLIAGILLTVVLAQQQQQTQQQATTNCGDTRNLIRNCDFSTAINFGNPTGTDWRDTAIDPTRNAGAGQYTREVAQASTTDHGLVGQIGKESGTCSLPKTAGGGGGDLFRLFPEIGQYVDVGNAPKFHVAFDFHMKSRHTRYLSAPFYVWTALTDGTGDKKGVEAFLAYVPHDTPGDVCEEQPFRETLKCKIGVGAPESDCTPAVSGWKRVEYDVERTTLCERDATCIANNKLFHIGFGVTNDFDTIVQVDNVVVTAEGISGPATPTPTQTSSTPTPTPTPPASQAQATFFFTNEGSSTRITNITKRPGDTFTLALHLDTKGSNISGYEVKVIFPDDLQLDEAFNPGINNFPNPQKYKKQPQLFQIAQTQNIGGAPARGDIIIARLKFTAKKIGSGRIKFDYTEGLAYFHVNYVVANLGGGAPPGGPTATPVPGGAGQPSGSRRTTFIPLNIPCVANTSGGLTFNCLQFGPRQ